VQKSQDEEATSLKHTPGACDHGKVDSYADGDHVDVFRMLLAPCHAAQDHGQPGACRSEH
jgi:hypothetical protein